MEPNREATSTSTSIIGKRLALSDRARLVLVAAVVAAGLWATVWSWRTVRGRALDIERALSIYWESDDETCRRVGWHLVRYTGTLFHLGRRLLELTSPGGALLPPREFRMCRESEPSDEEMFAAPMLQPWSLTLFQTGSSPCGFE